MNCDVQVTLKVVLFDAVCECDPVSLDNLGICKLLLCKKKLMVQVMMWLCQRDSHFLYVKIHAISAKQVD